MATAGISLEIPLLVIVNDHASMRISTQKLIRVFGSAPKFSRRLKNFWSRVGSRTSHALCSGYGCRAWTVLRKLVARTGIGQRNSNGVARPAPREGV
jgi:hypothetical protein